jgi:hypothetical protein
LRVPSSLSDDPHRSADIQAGQVVTDGQFPTPKEAREIWKRLTPEQRKMIEEEIQAIPI